MVVNVAQLRQNLGKALVDCPPHHENRSKSLPQLTWPKPGDGKRAVVGKDPRPSKRTQTKVHATRIIHVSQRDMEMHYHFTKAAQGKRARPTLEVPMYWNGAEVSVSEQELFQYFINTASKSLATFGYDSMELGEMLARLAMADGSDSSTAVYRSILAYASVHRNGIHSQSGEFKISALKALAAAAAGNCIGTPEQIIRQVAAGMLLSSGEIYSSSCTASEWSWYLRSVKALLDCDCIQERRRDRDVAILVDWVYYHDVLARFSLHYWQRDPKDSPLTVHPLIRAEPSSAAPPVLTLMELLSEVCDAVASAPTAAEHRAEHQNFVKILDWKIRNTKIQSAAGDSALVSELYRLALLVYLHRASGNLSSQGHMMQTQIDTAFGMLASLQSCERQFPVFVLGCEARTEEQRVVVMDLISRTESSASSRSFNYTRLLLQAMWAQCDLSDGVIDYQERMTYFISTCTILPSFV